MLAEDGRRALGFAHCQPKQLDAVAEYMRQYIIEHEPQLRAMCLILLQEVIEALRKAPWDAQRNCSSR
jgi:hypothetical protein